MRCCSGHQATLPLMRILVSCCSGVRVCGVGASARCWLVHQDGAGEQRHHVLAVATMTVAGIVCVSAVH